MKRFLITILMIIMVLFISGCTITPETVELELQCEGDGKITAHPDGPEYEFGEKVVLTGIGNFGWEFTHWSGDLSGTTNPATTLMLSDKEITAHFSDNDYTVTVSASPENAGIVEREGTFDYGELITVVATPANEWIFLSWTENGTVFHEEREYEFYIEENRNLIANFVKQDGYILTVNIDGKGTVFKDPDKEKYAREQEVEVEAFPHDGWEFSHWSGDLSGTETTKTLIMNEDKEIKAHFNQIMHTVTLRSEPSDGGDLSGEGTYPMGTEVTVMATPNENYDFYQWTEDGEVVHQDREYTFYLTEDRDLVANFIFQPEP